MDAQADNLIPPLNPGERMSDVESGAWVGHEYVTVASLLIRHANASEHSGEYTCVADMPDERTTETYNVVVKRPAEETAEEILEHLLQPHKRSKSKIRYKQKLYSNRSLTDSTANVQIISKKNKKSK